VNVVTWLQLLPVLFSSTAIRYDKKNHGYFSEDIYVGLCLFSPWQGIFYMSTLNTLLSATWQGICHGYHCLKCETTHAYGVPHFLCFDHPMHMLQIGDAKHKLGVLKFSGQVLVRQEKSMKK
jgi:hypothetical protein